MVNLGVETSKSYITVPVLQSQVHFQFRFLLMNALEMAVDGSRTIVLAIHIRGLDRMPVSWLLPGPALATVAFGK